MPAIRRHHRQRRQCRQHHQRADRDRRWQHITAGSGLGPFENNVDIDIAEDEVITVSYDVRVSDSVLANQVLANSVVAQWTGLDGRARPSVTVRTASAGSNDYITPEALATVATPDISATLAKSRHR